MRTHVAEPAVSGSFQTDQRFLDELSWIHRNRGRYAGKWVALAGNTLLATGDSAREVFDAAKGADVTPLIQYIEGETLPFAGW